MLVFVGLICAHWFGFTPDNLSEAEILELMDLVQIGLGGYVLGRSAESIREHKTKIAIRNPEMGKPALKSMTKPQIDFSLKHNNKQNCSTN